MFITRNDLQRIKRVDINRLENHLRAAGWTLDELISETILAMREIERRDDTFS